MINVGEIERLRQKRIGASKVTEPYLNKLILSKGTIGICDYSDVEEETISIGELANRVQTAFEQFLERTPEAPYESQYNLNADRSSGASWERSDMPVVLSIYGAAGIPMKAAEDIQVILEHDNYDYTSDGLGDGNEFSVDAYYEEKRTYDAFWQYQWEKFEKSLKTEARLFNQAVEQHLKSIFRNIEQLTTENGEQLLKTIGPESPINALFRARTFQSDEKLIEALQQVDRLLGTPKAADTKAGRMNSKGVAVFYGSTTEGAALSEVRPPVGSRVAVAKFDIIRPLTVIDLDSLENLGFKGSIFDPEYAEDFPRLVFLSGLGKKIAAAVMPDDEEVQYVTTQAIADFLATREHIQIDGMIYPSVQASQGRNVVLFHKAAKVERLSIVPGSTTIAKLREWTKEGSIPSYSITEVMPSKPVDFTEKTRFSFNTTNVDLIEMMLKQDVREDTLCIQQETIRIHHIDGVEYKTTGYDVEKLYEKEIDDVTDD